jgi:lipopolysaccharide/colanic/teichoic acid biosynthesis glycosyltransferase
MSGYDVIADERVAMNAGLSGVTLRRIRDVLGCLILLVSLMPLMVVAACLIRLDSPGPVFYRQERVGLHGSVFTMLKFRSMRIDAEMCGPCWAAKRDPRVTRFGAFMRLSRIDEIPQLFNVLRGEMSLIGPRPERPHFTEQLVHAIPLYNDRMSILPGITGWAQVNYPYGASVEDARIKLDYDLYYIRNRSAFLDFQIIAATVRVVMFGIGAR